MSPRQKAAPTLSLMVQVLARSDTTFFCAAAAEQGRIMTGINEFARWTTIILVRQPSPPRGDYIHITGENSGCWSFVGRIGGVSKAAKVVVKTSQALRNAPLGIRSRPHLTKKKHECTAVYLVLHNIPLGTILETFSSNCSNSLIEEL
jgi:hypothetical protein